jgi:hypothetical protein
MWMRKLLPIVVLLALLSLGLFAFPGRAAAATCTWDGANPGNWSDTSHWASCGGAYPSTSDTAVINSGTVTLDIPVTVLNLTLTSGTVTGANDLTITGSLTWNSGTMSGNGTTTLAATGTLVTSASGTPYLDTRTFNNAGTVNWNSTSYLYLTNNAVFNNQSGANYNIQTSSTYAIYGSTGTFNNLSGATFTKSSSGDTGIYNLTAFNNTGTLTLTSAGVLTLSPSGTSTHTGPFNVNNANATLTFQGGIHNINTGANITGSGNASFAGGTQHVHSTYNLSGATLVSGGAVDFPSDATLTSLGGALTISGGSIDLSSGESLSVSSLTMSGGTLTGDDTITVSTSLNWSGGTMSGFGVTNLAATGTMAASGSGTPTLDTRTFNNAGTVNWNSTGYFYLTNNAVFNNQSGANFNVQSAGTYAIYGSTGTFNNLSGATFTKSSSGNTGIYNLTAFNNTGTLTLTSAGVLILSPSGTSTHTGPFNVNNANATLTFQGGIHNINTGADITGSGSVNFAGGNEYVHSTYNLSGATLVSGGAVDFPSDATLTSLGGALTISGGSIDLSSGESLSVSFLTMSGGTLTGADTITVTTSLNWGSGTMSGAGATNLAASGTMITSATGYITLDGRTFNNAGTVNWSSTGYISLSSNATFNNLSGATFNTLSSGTYLFYGYAGNLVNAGTLNLPASSNLIANQFTQTASGVINMPVGGTIAGTDFCQITGTTSNLNGRLNITILVGYSPVFGDYLDVFSYTNHNGTFNPVSLPPLDSGLAWGISYRTDRLRIYVLYGLFLPITVKP